MTKADHHILVVDDDTRLRDLLRRYLAEHDFRITTAANAGQARAKLKRMIFDLIVLDVMMPGESGLELTESLRRTNAVPILLLTARDEPEDRIEGFDRGADDYLAKPFEPRELVARIRSILRRVAVPAPAEEAPSEVWLGACRYILAREELLGPDGPVRLTSAETRLLQVLASSPGQMISREELTQRSQFNGNVRAVDVQVTRLRRKIEPDPKQPRYLQTVRGQGYVLRPD
ncbi:MAG: response regulator [Alphaproteobacteria bacterium]